MAFVELEADLVLVACEGLKAAIYAEVGGGELAPMCALLKPEYSELIHKVENIAGLAQFASTYPAAGGRLLISDDEFRLISKFIPVRLAKKALI